MTNYKVTFKVEAYKKKDSVGFNYATGRILCKAKNKVDAINKVLQHYDCGMIYEDELGYYPYRVQLVEIISVDVYTEDKDNA